MKRLLVAIKRVIDYNVKVRILPDGSGVVTDGVKLSLNPFDEIALEEALRMKEKGLADEVVVATIAPADAQAQLRTALAMGADRALLVQLDAQFDSRAEPLDIARILLKLVEKEQPLAVLLGKQAVDGDNNQTGQMLAALWDRPQATFASKITIDSSVATVEREVDAGTETLEVDLPAVFTTDLRLNEPRYVKLPDIIKAKKKPLDTLTLESLGIALQPKLRTLKLSAPPVRGRGRMLKTADELVAELAQQNLLP